MEFPAMKQEKIDGIISQLGLDDIKAEEIDVSIRSYPCAARE